MQNVITIHFHQNANKAAFIRQNGFTQKEILEESPASIVIRREGNDLDWEQNVHVYQANKS